MLAIYQGRVLTTCDVAMFLCGVLLSFRCPVILLCYALCLRSHRHVTGRRLVVAVGRHTHQNSASACTTIALLFYLLRSCCFCSDVTSWFCLPCRSVPPAPPPLYCPLITPQMQLKYILGYNVPRADKLYEQIHLYIEGIHGFVWQEYVMGVTLLT